MGILAHVATTIRTVSHRLPLASSLITALRSFAVSVKEKPRLPSWRERQLSDTDKEWSDGEAGADAEKRGGRTRKCPALLN